MEEEEEGGERGGLCGERQTAMANGEGYDE
jgi:hypothetical protein